MSDSAEDVEKLAGINSGELATSGPVLDVKVEGRAGEMVVVPVNGNNKRRSLELRHSETDLLMAQLTDDPAITSFCLPGVGIVQASGSRMQRASTRNLNREELVWFGIQGNTLSAALGDRIIVRRDTLESEYVCRSCKGKGHTDVVCGLCDGKQRKDGLNCGGCRVLGFEADGTEHRPSGFQRCQDCNGVGWRNGIIIPEIAQGKPVTGVVVSLGPETKMVKLGDRVLHSIFAGHNLKTKAETFTYMRECEVISLLRDL